MQKLVKDYLNELNKKQKKRRKAITAAVVLIAMVVVSVIGSLTQYGVAMTDTTRTARCGQEEHTHSDACYEKRLICGLNEETGHSHTDACYNSDTPLCGLEESEGEEGHIHTDACYNSDTPLCGQKESEGHIHTDNCYEESSCTIEEHTHTDICYSDTSADVEDANVWNEQYEDVEWEGDWGDRLVTAARMQIGYQESTDNYTVSEDGSHKGYTRYGQFAAVMYEAYKNDPDTVYTDWDAAFADFCMFYAGLKGLDIFPDEIDAAKWCDEFIKKHEANEQTSAYLTSLTEAEGYTPEAGDLVFFEKENEDGAINEDGTAEKETRMGIVTSYNKEEKDNKVTSKITVIEGDSSDQVRENEYILEDEDNDIARYVKMAEIEKVYQKLNKEPGEDETNEPAEKPAVDPDGEKAGNQKPDEEESGDQKQDQTSEDDKDPSDSKEKEDDKDQSEDDQKKNSLTEEEQAEVDAVIKMIDELPTAEEVTDKFKELEEDEEGYEAYYQELQKQVSKAKKAYDALSEEQKKAVTNAERLQEFEWLETETLEETESATGGVMEKDQAYVNNIRVEYIQDGVTPFDDDNRPGNDKDDNNKIVRTFDTVNYDFMVEMKSYDPNQYFGEARVKFKFILPVTEKEATFDQSAMAWMDQTKGYEPKVTEEWHRVPVEDKEGEYEDKLCQVLICYEHLIPSMGNKSVVPGNLGRNVSVNVKSMKNGSILAPIFYATMEPMTDNEADKAHEYYPTQLKEVSESEPEGEEDTKHLEPMYSETDKNCQKEGHNRCETASFQADPVKVTAAPKYNIQLSGDSSYMEEFDFSDKEGLEEWAANQDKGKVPGRAMKFGITLQLYNDNQAKGLKGIEIPEGPITFDLKLSSKYKGEKNDSNVEGGKDVTNQYTPLLWSYGENKSFAYGGRNDDGRIINDVYKTMSYAPYSNQTDPTNPEDKSAEYSCYNSGEWKVEQDNNVLKITVKDYEINPDKMPINNGDNNNEDGVYGSYIGCFSSAGIWIVQPFNEQGKILEDKKNKYTVIEEYGTGAFTTAAEVINMKSRSISDQRFDDDENTHSKHDHNDDRVSRSVVLTLDGGMVNRIRYADAIDYTGKGAGVENTRDGRDFAMTGSEIRIASGFSYSSQQKEDNQLYWGTNLTKFYAKAIELIEPEGDQLPYDFRLDGGAQAKGVTVYYAAKSDGTDWNSDNEMQSTYEDKMVFYPSLSELKRTGKKCVGILYCFEGVDLNDFKMDGERDPYYWCYHRAMVKDDDNLIGKAFQLVSTSRTWSKEMFESAVKENANMTVEHIKNSIITGSADENYFKKLPGNPCVSANNDPGLSSWYSKETYDESGALGTHNSDWSMYGDTLLVIGYKTSITKNLMQKSSDGTKEKEVYNLDYSQSVVDFRLRPVLDYSYKTEGSTKNMVKTANVTIVDTIPRGLAYKEGTTYFGGRYSQTGVNGGTLGAINGGILIDEDPKKATEIKAATEKYPAVTVTMEVENNKKVDGTLDGTQTITWEIKNARVGETLPVIYYATDIGIITDSEVEGQPYRLAIIPRGTTQLLNIATITAPPGDRRKPVRGSDNYTEEGLSVARGWQNSYGKIGRQKLVEREGNDKKGVGVIDYTVFYNNNSPSNDEEVVMVDVMPTANDKRGNSFNGTYELNSWKLDITRSNPEDIKIYYTTDQSYTTEEGLNKLEKMAAGSISTPENQIVPAIYFNEWKSTEGKDKWKEASISISGKEKGYIKTESDNEVPVAWVVVGTVKASSSVNIDMQIKLVPDSKSAEPLSTNTYVNSLYIGDTPFEWETKTVTRSLEGLVWMDYDRDGVQDQDKAETDNGGIKETLVPADNIENHKTTVTLLKLKDELVDKFEEDDKSVGHSIEDYDVCMKKDGVTPITIETGQKYSLLTETVYENYDVGKYMFTDLPAGEYAVKFNDGRFTSYSWKATTMNAGASEDEEVSKEADKIDSDGIPSYTDGNQDGILSYTYIPQIHMPTIVEMEQEMKLAAIGNSYHYHSPHHDSGFYPDNTANFLKVGEDWNMTLDGAGFKVKDSSGNEVKFSGGDGNYKVLDNVAKDSDTIVSGKRYYIQYVGENGLNSTGNKTYTIGANDNGEIRLQEKTGMEAQQFIVYRYGDGGCSFQNVKTKTWLYVPDGVSGSSNIGLSGGNSSNPTNNIKWYLERPDKNLNGDKQKADKATSLGLYEIYTSINNWRVDLSNNSITQDNTIWTYEANDTWAQYWDIVSVDDVANNLEVDSNGNLKLNGLMPGTYQLIETKAPNGYALLNNPITITVASDVKGTITVNGNDANDSDARPNGVNGWKVKNNLLYELPSTGGPGIYWYMFGGVLLMATSSLITYRKRRREVLRS